MRQMNKLLTKNYNGAYSKCFSIINTIKRQLRRGIIIMTALKQSSCDLEIIKNWLKLSGCSRKQVNQLKIYWADNSHSIDEIKSIFKKHPNASVVLNNRYSYFFNDEDLEEISKLIQNRNAFEFSASEDNLRDEEDEYCLQTSFFPVNRKDAYRVTIYECGSDKYQYLQAEMKVKERD